MAIFSFVPMAVAQKGFSIEGGLVYDRPIDSDSRRAFDDLRSGFGYTGNLGYDFFDRFGLEVGVMHTRHDYDLSSSGGRVLEEVAGRTAFFLKVRGVPLRIAKSELVLEAGPGFFDINGLRQVPGGDAEASYSGWGFVSNASYRYHINEGLAVALLFGANIVKYSRFNLLGFETPVQGEYPRGNSLSWGLTVFHRIGIPQG
jgi:hypothetical protein